MDTFQKTAQVEEDVTPCEFCGHPSSAVIGGRAVCGIHSRSTERSTQPENIKKAEAQLTK